MLSKFQRNQKGFTLIELMIVVVIIGILAALAIPRFMAATTKSKMSEAKTMLKQVHVLMRSYYQESDTYVGATLAGIGFVQQPLVTAAPAGPARYTIAITSALATTYAATATSVVDFDGDGVMNVWTIADNGTNVTLTNTIPD